MHSIEHLIDRSPRFPAFDFSEVLLADGVNFELGPIDLLPIADPSVLASPLIGTDHGYRRMNDCNDAACPVSAGLAGQAPRNGRPTQCRVLSF
jgi:hypothetical protein